MAGIMKKKKKISLEKSLVLALLWLEKNGMVSHRHYNSLRSLFVIIMPI